MKFRGKFRAVQCQSLLTRPIKGKPVNCNPYLQFNIGDVWSDRTDVFKKNTDPVFPKFVPEFMFEGRNEAHLENTILRIEYWNKYNGNKKDHVGTVVIDMLTIATGPVRHRLTLLDTTQGDAPVGILLFELFFEEFITCEFDLLLNVEPMDPSTDLDHFFLEIAKTNDEENTGKIPKPQFKTPLFKDTGQFKLENIQFEDSTYRELAKSVLIVSVKTKKKKLSKLSIANSIASVRFNDVNLNRDDTVISSKLISSGRQVATLVFVISWKSLPEYAQMMGSLHTDTGLQGEGTVVLGAYPPHINGIHIDTESLEKVKRHVRTERTQRSTRQGSDNTSGSERNSSGSGTKRKPNTRYSDDKSTLGRVPAIKEEPLKKELISVKSEEIVDPHDLPVPEGWEKGVNPQGRPYYIDHINKRTQWTHPLENIAPKPEPSVQVTTISDKTEKERDIHIESSIDLLDKLARLSELPTGDDLSRLLGDMSESADSSSSDDSGDESIDMDTLKKYPYFLRTESSDDDSEASFEPSFDRKNTYRNSSGSSQIITTEKITSQITVDSPKSTGDLPLQMSYVPETNPQLNEIAQTDTNQANLFGAPPQVVVTTFFQNKSPSGSSSDDESLPTETYPQMEFLPVPPQNEEDSSSYDEVAATGFPPPMGYVTDAYPQMNYSGNLPPQVEHVPETNPQMNYSGDLPPQMGYLSETNPQLNYSGDLPPQMGYAPETNLQMNYIGGTNPQLNYSGDLPPQMGYSPETNPQMNYIGGTNPQLNYSGDLPSQLGYLPETNPQLNYSGDLPPQMGYVPDTNPQLNYSENLASVSDISESTDTSQMNYSGSLPQISQESLQKNQLPMGEIDNSGNQLSSSESSSDSDSQTASNSPQNPFGMPPQIQKTVPTEVDNTLFEESSDSPVKTGFFPISISEESDSSYEEPHTVIVEPISIVSPVPAVREERIAPVSIPPIVDPHSLPVPTGWEKGMTPDGRPYYIDHINKATTWDHPLAYTLQQPQPIVETPIIPQIATDESSSIELPYSIDSDFSDENYNPHDEVFASESSDY